MSALWQYGYLSRLAAPEAEVAAILDHARRRNAGLGLTGVLLFDGHSFLQVLEGERAAIADVAARLTVDRRHRQMQGLFLEPAEMRWFTGFEMQFREVRKRAPSLARAFDPERFDTGAAAMFAVAELLFPPG